jgi:chromosomal replication initiation ATPase DnaA
MTPTEAIAYLAGAQGVEVAELVDTHRRPHHVVRARRITWYVLREAFGLSYPYIGEAFEAHHVSVMTGVGQIRRAAETDPDLADHLAVLVDLCRPRLALVGDRRHPVRMAAGVSRA